MGQQALFLRELLLSQAGDGTAESFFWLALSAQDVQAVLLSIYGSIVRHSLYLFLPLQDRASLQARSDQDSYRCQHLHRPLLRMR